jgi:competence protein ComEC
MLVTAGSCREGQAKRWPVVSRTRTPIQTGVLARILARRSPPAAGWAHWLTAERDRLPLWLPVALAAGIALWFALPVAPWRLAAAAALLALCGGAGVAGWRWPAGLLLMALLGMAACEVRVGLNHHQILPGRLVATLDAQVEVAEPQPFGGQRLLLVARPGQTLPGGIQRARITVRGDAAPVPVGAHVQLRALLSPPAGAVVPGGLDIARRLWFAGIGATGVALGPIRVAAGPPPGPQLWLEQRRAAIEAMIARRLPGEAGAVSAAFVTGRQTAIPPATAQAMRDAGLAHLLSISGLHIAVVVGTVALLARALLALSPWLALRVAVPTLALGIGALAGIAYSLLAGAQVPTVRAAIAASIVVIGMMLGRQALSLRLLAAAALLILLLRPEALLGASFQMSFAAVIGIVALYESRLGQWLTAVREDEAWWHRLARGLASLLASGLVAEFALSGIGLYHFGRSGLYGIAANIIAIPFTSFVVMPALLLALLGEALGLGWLWPLAGWAMQRLIDIADFTAALPGAVITSAAIPAPAFALGAAGGLWLALWRSGARWWGLVPILAAGLIAARAPLPDLLISADGRHVAMRLPDGRLAHSRQRVGDYVIGNWAESVGSDAGAAQWWGLLPNARCSADACIADIARDGRRWRVLATTSRDYIARPLFEPACAAADIVVADRRLPAWCRPRWLKLDAAALASSGAVTIILADGAVTTAAASTGDRPWQARPASRWWR